MTVQATRRLALAPVVARSQIRGTKATKGKYGDGLVVTTSSKLRLWDSLVTASARAGLVVDSSGGYARRCVFDGGLYPIAVSGGTFVVTADNVFSRNQSDKIVTGVKVPTADPPKLPQAFYK